MNWNEPTDEMRAAWQEWLAERPRFVRSVAECFNPWTMYRLITTGQRCQVLAFAEDGTVRIYAENEHLGPMTGTEVYGVSPADLVQWDGEPRQNWRITVTPSTGEIVDGFVMGDKVTFDYEDEP